jgi:hypothetical protein
MRAITHFVLAALLATSSAAAQDYPTKPVTIVVPFAAGGAGDILARLAAPHLEKRFGKPFIVENRPGAGGVVGAAAVNKTIPDGHTIMIAPSPTLAVNVTLFKKLPYEPATDFMPLAMAAGTPFVLVVNPSLRLTGRRPHRYVKERPGRSPTAPPARASPPPIHGVAEEPHRSRHDTGCLQAAPGHHRRCGFNIPLMFVTSGRRSRSSSPARCVRSVFRPQDASTCCLTCRRSTTLYRIST